MSLRTLLFRCYHNGKVFIRYIKPGNPNVKIEVKSQPKLQATKVGIPGTSYRSAISSQPGIQSYIHNARQYFVDNLLNRVTNSLASDLKQRTVKELLYRNNSSPFFAFVGVSLASGTGMLTKDDEFEGICWEIRHAVSSMFDKLVEIETLPDVENTALDDVEIGDFIAKGANAVVYNVRFRNVNFALKMMFNYDTESNSFAILNAMNKELAPLRNPLNKKNLLLNDIDYIPPHPNVVVMHFAFTDFVPSIPNSSLLYPSALPARLNPVGGYGRNMSLFILMKKYSCDLKTYLSERGEINIHECMLLLSQLLEGVTHLNSHYTAHRDLKSDNLLLDCSESENCPQLVITDFGCSYTNKSGLSMPYNSPMSDKGGNVALMAPEVLHAQPGIFSFINYNKSDVWTCGALAYEIFGEENPFYNNLQSSNYKQSDLPKMSNSVPVIIRNLIRKLLANDPQYRPSAYLAATICQLYLWAPKHWLQRDHATPTHSEVLQWLLTLTTKVLCTHGTHGQHTRRTFVEYQLISTFLRRIEFRNIVQALKFIQNELCFDVK